MEYSRYSGWSINGFYTSYISDGKENFSRCELVFSFEITDGAGFYPDQLKEWSIL
jgi:hypothetical protein